VPGDIFGRLIRASREDHRSVLTDFADMLRDRGLLAWRISEGLFGLKFLFRSSLPALPEMTFLTIPIKAELFPILPSELERNKADYLRTIVPVNVRAGHLTCSTEIYKRVGSRSKGVKRHRCVRRR
jgi:hypothetical protein